ncbi:histidine phosphatase family protein [Vibrio hibernica]|uniref:histidine phosphatase family protein n=1 Tax=Vibrio hibernica TaxID=2587465 RepID=UPI0018828F5D|nr:histidine phosphatase family protein [Vibrio hibernica]
MEEKYHTQTLYLIRHAKVIGDPALYGHTDAKVNGEDNQNIALRLSGLDFTPDCIVTSSLYRCHSLATEIARHYPISIQVNAQFKEMNFGDFDGILFDELSQEWTQLERFWADPAEYPLPNSELLSAFYDRITQAWQQLLDAQSGDGLLICHGGVIRMILAGILGVDFKQPQWHSSLQIANGSTTQIDILRDSSGKVLGTKVVNINQL